MAPARRSSVSLKRRRRLLCGASVVVLAAGLGGAGAQAQTASALHGAAHLASAAGVPAIAAPATSNAPVLTPPMQSASARALTNQAAAARSLGLAQQAQQAARISVASITSATGVTVTPTDGLSANGLMPAANLVPAAHDPTGLSTWQGAGMPVQTQSNGSAAVSITQTDARAVLSWASFNVGPNTTLAYQPPSGQTANNSWVTLNRVVGQIDPATGLRRTDGLAAPSAILGKITAPWTVLVLNPNGVLFGSGAQVNTYSFAATSLDIGQALSLDAIPQPLTIAQRNQNFLQYGLVGLAEQASVNQQLQTFTFSPLYGGSGYDPVPQDGLGGIEIQAGATVSSASTGWLLFTGQTVSNAGTLLSPQGEVALQSGRQVFLNASDGSANSLDPNVRGYIVSAQNRADVAGNSVVNQTGGLIEADDGYISLGATPLGSTANFGVLQSSTSVSRNGFVRLTGGDIRLGPGSVIAITPDTSGGTIPQDPTSLGNFKSSQIQIGDAGARIEIDGVQNPDPANNILGAPGALIYAPSANVQIGAAAGATVLDTPINPAVQDSRVFIDSGATIDVAGLTDVEVAASANSVQISPVTTNDIQDTPNAKALLGATVYIDPRLSGVRADGVHWVGSPILSAAGFAQQVGVEVTQLMTKGGNVTLGVASANPASLTASPDIIVKPGAVIDVSGGWVSYLGGWIKTSRLIDANGGLVDISLANPNASYVGVYQGYTANQPRWGVSQSFIDPLQADYHFSTAYTEGHDAGSLSVVGSIAALDGAVYANAYAGSQQRLAARPGTAASSIFGDSRPLQSIWTQLPAGGYLSIEAAGQTTSAQGNALTGGGDIEITGGTTGSSTATLTYGAPTTDPTTHIQTVVRSLETDSLLAQDRQQTILLSAPALSAMGLSQLSLTTSGRITVDPDAALALQPGGIFSALSGRALTVSGSVSAPSGSIRLTTAQLLQQGSIYLPDSPAAGSFDLVVDGQLSVAGMWVNDYLATPDTLQGASYLNGGSISVTAAPSVLQGPGTVSVADTRSGAQPQVNTDISGSILVEDGALLDLSGGGYVSPTGALSLTSKGGNLSLTEATTYFQLVNDGSRSAGAIEGLRVNGLLDPSGIATLALNPASIDAVVSIAPGTVRANGFAGGGAFNLTTPAFSFGSDAPSTGTALPLDFFDTAGFGSYKIASYKTALLPNGFTNGLGGYNAILQTQVLTVGPGQVLDLTQSGFSPVITADSATALRGLATGGDLYSVLTPGIPAAAWDRAPVSLTLGGLIELDVATGGRVQGAPGASLTASLLLNKGVIRLPGGTLTQSEVLPELYAGANTLGVTSLAQAFGGDGLTYDETAPNALGVRSPATGQVYANKELIGIDNFVLLGNVDHGVGVQLAPGSVTDLSGLAVTNPRPLAVAPGSTTPINDGKVYAGGVFQAMSGLAIPAASDTTPGDPGNALFATPPGGQSLYSQHDPLAARLAGVVEGADAFLSVAGASAVYDRLSASGGYAPTLVWSDAGALTFGGGALLTGLTLNAAGGAPRAQGGTLTIPDLVLTQSQPANPQLNELSADMLGSAGVSTLVAQGGLTTDGDVSLRLGRAFFLTSAVYGGVLGQDISSDAGRDLLGSTVSATGDLSISAPSIGLQSSFQTVSTPGLATPAQHTVTFSGAAIDIVGAVRFDQSVATLNLSAQQDVRLIGVQPWQLTYNVNPSSVANSLAGELVTNGDLNITAAQVYPATGSSFQVTSTAANGTITIAATPGSTPGPVYSAGGALTVQAANIVQGGTVIAPLGQLTLGSNAPLIQTSSAGAIQFAPKTASLTLKDGGVTSVSAGGLSIPYGVTTDQTEWYFSPTTASPLTAPPNGVLSLAASAVTIDAGAKVNVQGGGDVYAYEFVPGTGGSHDLLSQFNTDAFSSNNGYQYPDRRQVYAIVPGLSNNAVAAYDPIYSGDVANGSYANLYQPSAVGRAVYLTGAAGVPAGWYTLLPAQYALLPGGMRIVQDTTATGLPPQNGSVLRDGSVMTSGYYGTAGGLSASSNLVTFEVQTQATFSQYSNIALTSANTKFAAVAAANHTPTPRLPVDAGRLVIDPVLALQIDAPMLTSAGSGGRGAEADILGTRLDIVSAFGGAPADGVVTLTADELSRLNAASLLIGGRRSANGDGSTNLDITAQSIVVENDKAHPLTAPEVILAVDGAGSSINVRPGAAIVATGASDASGALDIDGGGADTGQGAVLRVAAGDPRTVNRTNIKSGLALARLRVGANATLSGTSVLLDSAGLVLMSQSVKLAAANLGIDALHIQFAPVAGPSLTITPQLAAKFAAAGTLSLNSPNAISFAAGDYQFAALSLQTPALASSDNGPVSISATSLTLANPTGSSVACAGLGDCGAGSLRLNAGQLIFKDGVLTTPGFDGGVTLTATGSVVGQGVGGLDAGAANLSIQTPFVGDMASLDALGAQAKVGLAFTTSGALTVSNPSAGKAPTVQGVPGASLSLSGQTLSITDTDLRATSGALTLTSATGVSIAGSAVLSAAGYDKSFGDPADPFSVPAPGGKLSIQAGAGDIDLASGTTLSIGGGSGTAGTLSLTASGGLQLDGKLDARAPAGAASLQIDTGGPFDLAAFTTRFGPAFTGDIAVHSGAGDLSLAAGQQLTATSIDMTADGGQVRIAGGLDVSGVNGGSVSLFGAQGVTLASNAVILARAEGYASPGSTPGSPSNTDTRQATGGSVTLGVDGAGAIAVAAGAVIDVGAVNNAPRLVSIPSSGGAAYAYVPGDLGGSLTLRAPVVTQNGSETVNVSFSGQVNGAQTVVMEGFEHVNLAAVAASGSYVGVTQNAGQIVLDVGQAGPRPNFLADNAPGTLVNFIQSFDLSAANAKLGVLPTLAAFSARPGVELDYSGDIVLASNWNLGAGVVNVAGAVQAGLMAPDPALSGRYYVLSGADSTIFSNYTTLTYRVGGQVTGAPGVLTIRAGGKLDLQGSITDGFFNFRDQTDPGYVSLALGGGAPGSGARVNQAWLAANCFTGDCTAVDPFVANTAFTPSNFIYFSFPLSLSTATGIGNFPVFGTVPFDNPAPYSASANSPSALGQLTTPTASTGGGDAIGGAAMFPQITVGGAQQGVSSWSYRLTGGADGASANPLAVQNGSGDVVAEGMHPYVLSGTAPNASFAPHLRLLSASGTNYLTPANWLSDFESVNSPVSGDAYTTVDWTNAVLGVRSALQTDVQAFVASSYNNGDPVVLVKPSGSSFVDTLKTTLANADKFLTYIDSGPAPVSFGSIVSLYKPPNSAFFAGSKTVVAPTLIRSGNGSISIAAGGSIDLRNGAAPTLQTATGAFAPANAGGLPLGGVAVYTAGLAVNGGAPVAVDGVTTPLTSGSTTSVFDNLPAAGYRYGAGASPTANGVGFTDIMLADPVYAEGGGNVTLTAGLDVLGRRDVAQTARLNTDFNTSQSLGYSWIGQGDQPWRTGAIGAVTDVRIDPQLFQEGVGTLGGGSISITAGRNISDLSVVADTTVGTFALPSAAGAPAGAQGLLTLGGGSVKIFAGGSLLGGRVDVASGSGSIRAQGDIISAGLFGPAGQIAPNDLVLRLTDADVSISAGGQVQMQGVGALGVRGATSAIQANLDAMGFYSPAASVSIVADGAVSIENAGLNVHNDGTVLLTAAVTATGGVPVAVYPGSFEAVSLTGALNLQTPGATPGIAQAASSVIMTPSPFGSLTLAAASDVSSQVLANNAVVTTDSVIQIEDADPSLLPGAFSNFTTDQNGAALTGLGFAFNPVYSDTPETTLRLYHNRTPTHSGDVTPNRVYAGRDLIDMTLQTPKQTRVGAGRDIVNMMFFGQNLAAADVTRIVAGRDITGTTKLVQPVVGLPSVFGAELPAVQGNSFVIGGPGTFLLEAGRNAGPFLNSAVTDGVQSKNGATSAAGQLTYGGGILSVGDQWNPWLPFGGADVYTEFGVGKGQDYHGLVEAYLNPANLGSMPDYLFAQLKTAAGTSVADRTQPIYGPVLIGWMQAHAAAVLETLYGSTDVTFQQAYDAFVTLPALEQQAFLLKNVYFNELAQTSIPTSASYKQYARGYTAVNTLFPSSLGYTANNLTGGSNGASNTVSTGDLDLRLASIQTAQGGDIFILGPGGRVLAGSTVSTTDQAARRAYVGGALYGGAAANGPLASDIASIPVGLEGILTLQGGGVYAFTDKSFLLNQSRLFTEAGGDIVMWSSNADLNAGEGAKTSADFPPIAVTVSQDLFDTLNKDANVTGAGIAAFEPAPGVPAPNVYLIAPRGTVDAGAAGVRVAGNLFIAANAVANADNFKVQGSAFGIPQSGAVNIGAQTSANSAAAAAAANAQNVAGGQGAQPQRSTISVNILGFDSGGTESLQACAPSDLQCRR
jgi:filamentous hemagglutinin family protein